MGSYNNKGITVIIVIHVIHFKGLQHNSIAVIGKKDKSRRGNYQINVLVLTVCDDESWIEGVPNYSSVFPWVFLHHNAIHVHKQEYSDMYLFMAFAMGV